MKAKKSKRYLAERGLRHVMTHFEILGTSETKESVRGDRSFDEMWRDDTRRRKYHILDALEEIEKHKPNEDLCYEIRRLIENAMSELIGVNGEHPYFYGIREALIRLRARKEV